jgi:hypothetical protein
MTTAPRRQGLMKKILLQRFIRIMLLIGKVCTYDNKMLVRNRPAKHKQMEKCNTFTYINRYVELLVSKGLKIFQKNVCHALQSFVALDKSLEMILFFQ